MYPGLQSQKPLGPCNLFNSCRKAQSDFATHQTSVAPSKSSGCTENKRALLFVTRRALSIVRRSSSITRFFKQ